MLQPGSQLERFVIQKQLGRGGMGTVFLAHDTLLDTAVALKVLNPSLAHSEGFERFRREALLARRITHPGVCRLFDIHVHAGIYFLSMEYVEGPTLAALIRESGVLPAELARDILVAICRALAAAHELDVLHRDLKPGNILVRGHDRISILDFGLSKALDQAGITDAEIQVGTVHYMAPELVGGGVASCQSDLYSVGVILFEAVTGRLPFAGNDIVELQSAILAGKKVPPRQFVPELPDAIDQCIQRAMALDPTARYDSARAFEQALLEAFEDSRPVAAKQPASASMRKLPSEATSLYQTPNAQLLARATAASDAPGLPRLPSVSPPTLVAPPTVGRGWWWPALSAAVLLLLGLGGGWWLLRQHGGLSFDAGVGATTGAGTAPGDPGAPAAGADGLAAALQAQRAAIDRLRLERGIIVGDSAELDASLQQLEASAVRGELAAALGHSGRALELLGALAVDQAFVEAKLIRFNRRFDAEADPALAGKLSAVARASLAAMASGDYQGANRALNRAFALLDGTPP